jgi:ADP-ribosylglycohydrolase
VPLSPFERLLLGVAGKRYEWRIGETTDDTEQTLAVTRALLRKGRVSHKVIGRELLQCVLSARLRSLAKSGGR